MQRRTTKPHPQKPRRAFTLVELTVSVGVIALIGVGLAAVFASVGETVQAGRKVSALTETAAAFERQLRNDIENMARDGFLVIRNEYAAGGAEVRLSTDDESPRPRRIDELLFFSRGNFETAREPVVPGVIARATEARIYYGHGQAFEPVPFSNGPWAFGQPTLASALSNFEIAGNSSAIRNEFALGVEVSTRQNPNAFASDWMLLRDVLLLKQPQVVSDALAASWQARIPIGFGFEALRDNDIQVALQPAARSIFRSVNSIVSGLPTENVIADSLIRPRDTDLAGLIGGQGVNQPWLESGLVDIATTDLAEIRTLITQPAVINTNNTPFDLSDDVIADVVLPSTIWNRAANSRGSLTSMLALPNNLSRSNDEFRIGSVEEMREADILPEINGQDIVQMQHAWMADALPGPSFEIETLINGGLFQTNLLPTFADEQAFFLRTRRRFEPTPPGYYRSLLGGGQNASPAAAFDSARLKSDKNMLVASNFAPRCTEFIVEWTFGEVGYVVDGNQSTPYNDGEPIRANDFLNYRQSSGNRRRVGRPGSVVWYGAERFSSDSNLDRENELLARPLPRGTPGVFGPQLIAEWRNNLATLIHGRQVNNYGLPFSGGPGSGRSQIDDGTGFNLNFEYRREPLTSFFGYADPRYDPQDPLVAGLNGRVLIHNDINNDGIKDPGEVGFDPGSWPWPTALRITASFADPSDPLNEESIQFVVEIPQPDRF